MGDSDGEQHSNNTNNNFSSDISNNSNNANLQSNNNTNSNNKQKNNQRDKFYRERDDNNTTSNAGSNGGGSAMNNHNNNSGSYHNSNNSSSANSNNRDSRRDWNNDRSSSTAATGGNRSSSSSYSEWKGGSSGGGGRSSSSYGSSSYGSGGNSYPRKYSGSGGNSSPPPHKRGRRDWNQSSTGSDMDRVYNNSNSSDSKNMPPPYSSHSHSSSSHPNSSESDYPTQPQFLSFKLFLQQQSDDISDEDAIKRYNEYKIDFKRSQISNFFIEHKEEDWFRSRYHPDENYKRRTEHNRSVLARLRVFMDMLDSECMDSVQLETIKSKELVRLLDTFVIKLEGGDDQLVKQLLDGVASSETAATTDAASKSEIDKEKSTEKEEQEETKEEKDSEKGDGDKDKTKKEDGDKDEEEKNKDKEGDDKDDASSKTATKRKAAEDSGSESGAYTEDDSDDQSDGSDDEGGKKSRRRKRRSAKKDTAASDSTKKQNLLHKTASIFMRNLAPSVTKHDLEELCNKKCADGFKRVALSDPAPERGFFRRGWITFEANTDVKKICWSLQNVKVKECNPGAIVNRELTNRIRATPGLAVHHKQVVKNNIKLAMRIIQNMDKRWNLWQDGKQDKDNENENVDDVQNDTKKDATNVEQEQKTADANGEKNGDADSATAAKKSETTPAEDKKTAVENENARLEREAFAKLKPHAAPFLEHEFKGGNPLLENITEYLVDEVAAEEEELLKEKSTIEDDNKKRESGSPEKSEKSSIDIEVDQKYLNQLDKLVLYLRMVHSIDYYNSIEYQQEDLMPNRCGIMFVRQSLPLTAPPKLTNEEINSFISQFETKMKPYTEYKEKVDADVALKLGVRVIRDETEKFIKLNTQELAADRWLCPLSGKRFKGPEFIRKHLFYKHMEKIMDVKRDVEFFNNYVMDPKRPQLPEHPLSGKTAAQAAAAGATASASASVSSGGVATSVSTGGGHQNQSNRYQQSSYQQSGGAGGYQGGQHQSGYQGQGYGGAGNYGGSSYGAGNQNLQGQLQMGGQQQQQMAGYNINRQMNAGGGGWQQQQQMGGYGGVSGCGDMSMQQGGQGQGQGQYGGVGGNSNQSSYGMNQGGGGGRYQQQQKPWQQGQGQGQYGGGGGGYNQNNPNMRRGRDSREMIQYRDLDAPDDA